MQTTIFDTPVVNTAMRGFSRLCLRWAGWRVEGGLAPQAQRCVLIAAPHTSNWDLPYTLMAAFVFGLKPRWMGKAQIFRFPFGGVMRWLGGLAVNRERSTNLVAASAQALCDATEPMQLIVPPEGTRAKVREWKTGFYYIALQAGVPIQLAYMDYAQKRVGLGPVFQPTGDLEADMARIKAFYAPFKGKNAQQFDAH